jgi:hypothetical protein
MENLLAKTSSIKLAWNICWPAFWTGFPFKLIAAVLLLAMQVHPWEGAGLATLLVISIPIDIWALGLTARTYFLERHSVELEGNVGLALWWQGAVIGGLFVAAAYYVVGGAVTVSKQIATSIIDLIKRIYPGLPIAEQITIELLLWTVPTAIVALILGLVALQLYGWRVKATVESIGRATGAPYPERVRRVDYSRIPGDPGLMLTSFAALAVLLTIAFWVFLPVTTPHPNEEFQQQTTKPAKPVKPEDILKQTETALAKAEAVLQTLEQDKGKEKKSKDMKKPEQKGK